ncbi:MAG: 3-methylaspartate ammonia-lyase [Gammaproteobacteria bacterium]|nr:MAG: 3-methylaspartate ammonia-lyase [Gammaproteobacteria bacterium]PHR83836.1 MAG: 3-methylaspartate ammonia-lyase [Colwellia sp.]
MLTKPIKIIVPAGSLGAGVREEEIEYGLSQGANVIATDAGSTDSGAAYLALGISKNNRGSVKRDLTILMKASMSAKIPLIIGTCGQAGGDKNVNWTKEIVIEIAKEINFTPKIAVLYSEQDKDVLKQKNDVGAITPLPPLGALNNDSIDVCEHIVAAMGVEPYTSALESGVDIILGGRTTDTAVIASYALWKGAPWGPSWHAAKIAECGAQCCVSPTNGAGVLLSIDNDGFEVEPLNVENQCSPDSVSAHMLYENSNPFELIEPGGILDVTDAKYVQVDDRTVKVTGSVWKEMPYTLKLEGAAIGRYQTIMLIGIQDPEVLGRLDEFHDKLLYTLNERVVKTMGLSPDDFDISLRIYGWNGVSGEKLPENTPAPREVGILFVATAETQEIASQVAKACNPYFFHFPINLDEELPSYGFAFSPADIDRGPVYEFQLNHVVSLDDPLELVRIKLLQL